MNGEVINLYAIWETTEIAVSGITLNKSSLSLNVGSGETLTATISPDNATNKSIIWNSSDEKVAKVTNGTVTAIGAGNATITASTADGTKKATCTVTVKKVISENAPIIKASSATATKGGTVEVKIDISNNPGIIAMLFNVEYDTRLTLLSVENGSVLPNPQHNTSNVSKNPFTVNFASDTATENITSNGTIITFKFKVHENADTGTAPIKITYDASNAAIYDKDFNDVNFEIINGEVTIADFIYGDLNGDGKVNQHDRTVLSRHLAGWDSYEKDTFNYFAADLNGDGKVNQHDRTILSRFIAKWDGYETLPKVSE